MAKLVGFLDFVEYNLREVYTTKTVEAFQRLLLNVTKNKGSWENDKTGIKQVYINLTFGRLGWKKKVFNWNVISRKLC